MSETTGDNSPLLADMLKRQLIGGEKPVPSGSIPAQPDEDEAWQNRELRKIRAFQMWHSVLTPQPAARPAGEAAATRTEEKLGVDLGTIFKAMADQVTTAYSTLADLMKKNPQSNTDPYLQHLESELKEVKQTLQGAGADPLEAITSSYERMNQLSQVMREHLGIPASAPAAVVSDIVPQIQLEEVKQRTLLMQQQHDKEMAVLKRGFEKEDKRWEEEFSLKRLQFVENKRMRSKAGDLAEGLIGGLLDSFKVGGEGEEGIFAGGKSGKYRCPECGATLKLTDPNAAEVTCQVCHTPLVRPEEPPKG